MGIRLFGVGNFCLRYVYLCIHAYMYVYTYVYICMFDQVIIENIFLNMTFQKSINVIAL